MLTLTVKSAFISSNTGCANYIFFFTANLIDLGFTELEGIVDHAQQFIVSMHLHFEKKIVESYVVSRVTSLPFLTHRNILCVGRGCLSFGSV